ncbi:MAG: repressor LexA, partial [Thermotogaceae bacterium]|nr:repressor LexA [Thermotogaceae bacterium]
MKGLTKRQRDVLNFINAYISKYGFSPSIRDIAREFRITPRGASIHLIALEKKGYITRSKKARSVRVVNRIEGIKLPLVGTIAAGNAIEALENQTELIEVPMSMVKSGYEHFLLRVKGTSMIEEHIIDRDLVVIRKQNTASNGDIVAVLVDNADATLKKFYAKSDKVILKPANRELKPLELESSRV